MTAPLPLSVGATRASDVHAPRTYERPHCLGFKPSPFAAARFALEDALLVEVVEPPAPPAPKPPKQQAWEDIRELPPTFKLSLVPLHELVEPRAAHTNVLSLETEKARIEAEKAHRRAVVEAVQTLGIAA